jgi:glycerol-3-phosphate O-acyltransferase
MSLLTGKFWALFTRARLQPEDAAARLDPQLPVCYVMELASDTDLAVLRNVCTGAHLPRPTRRLPGIGKHAPRAAFALARRVGVWNTRLDRRTPEVLRRLLQAARADSTFDVQLVPAAVYWSRAPRRERSFIRLLLSDDWVIASRLRRLFTILINGRRAVVQLGAPLSLRALNELAPDVNVAARRATRQLRGVLARQRTAHIGPDLSHRRTIVAEVLRTRAVRAAMAQLVNAKTGVTRHQALQQARDCVDEIAANYSHAFVAILARMFAWVWNRRYDGVEVGHIDTLAKVAPDHELVYVPCHRSHTDYLLLSYAIFQHGYAVPHIAAGINLNIPVVGRFLRKGGAFFIRRSFRGNALYTAVVGKYLGAIMARGHSIEYFIEGGRSRTGRLLAPATGMLNMTVMSYLRQPRRPVAFVPVYFGYERIFEGRTYIGELSGRPKEKESVGGLIGSAGRFLRGRYGRVHVNFGEPILLDQRLDAHNPAWRTETQGTDERPRWVVAVVNELADDILRQINAAAVATPVNLLALALLATPRQAALEENLLQHISLLQLLMRALPYHERVLVTDLPPAAVVEYGIGLNMLHREQHRSGSFVRMSAEDAVLATYYRNNVLHLVALPSMLACCFAGNATMRSDDVQRLALRIYPYVAAELHLRWTEAELPDVVRRMLAALAGLDLLYFDAGTDCWSRPAPTSAAAMQLSLLAQSTLPTIERYYLAISVLIRAGSNQITQKEVEERCQLTAQQMTLLYGFNSPEFFDRALFGDFINLLRARDVVRADANGRLEYDEVLRRVAADAELVLSEQIRHSILQVAHA